MRELTDEQIIELIRKHRAFFIAEIDSRLCLDHYNFVHELNLTEKDVKLQKAVCYFCNEEKDCVKDVL